MQWDNDRNEPDSNDFDEPKVSGIELSAFAEQEDEFPAESIALHGADQELDLEEFENFNTFTPLGSPAPLDASDHLSELSNFGAYEIQVDPSSPEEAEEFQPGFRAGRRLLFIAVSSSAVLHSILAVALVLFRPEFRVNEPASPPELIAIRLTEENPLIVQEPQLVHQEPQLDQELQPDRVSEEENATEPQELSETELVNTEQLPEESEQIQDNQLAEQTVPDIEEPGEESLSLAEDQIPLMEESVERGVTLPSIPQTTRLVPNVAAMRDSIQRMNDEREARSWINQCNPLQEEDELIECSNSQERNSDTRYARALQNQTYTALNPVFTRSRTQQTISTITGLSPEIAEQIETAGLPEWMVDFAIQEMERNISEATYGGSATERTIIQMTDKSEAALQARKMFGDVWLQNTVREAMRRNVHTPDPTR